MGRKLLTWDLKGSDLNVYWSSDGNQAERVVKLSHPDNRPWAQYEVTAAVQAIREGREPVIEAAVPAQWWTWALAAVGERVLSVADRISTRTAKGVWGLG